MSLTIQDLCEALPSLDNQAAKASDGFKPMRPPTKLGEHHFTPEELLTLRVPVVNVNGVVRGYQRPFLRAHARKMALAMRAGEPMPEIKVAIDGNGVMSTVDGQHRAVAGVLSGMGMLGLVRKMSKDEQRKLFANQRKAKAVDRNVLILAGTNPYEMYIRAACESDKHPWGRMASAAHSSKTRMSPSQMLNLLLAYVGNTTQVGSNVSGVVLERWDERLADELAPLIACFGNKQTNPLAFRASALRAIGQTTMYVFRRNEALETSDYERWVQHMPRFPWEEFAFVRFSADLTVRLVGHWNKRLHEGRRVSL